MVILAYVLSGLSLLMSVILLIQPKTFQLGWIAFFPKLTAGTLSPIWAITGAAGAAIGWVYQALWAIPIGIIGAGIMIGYILQCTRDHKEFEKVFGPGWSDQIPTKQAKGMVQKRWSPYLNLKVTSQITWERDIPYWTVSGTDRELLCDIWRPTHGDVSGLAFIYIHGGGWFLFDKDFGTRPFFRHLAAQGHTVMDVSYRLCPEVDIYGMVGDVKRAVAWMKTNASRFGVDPQKIVLGGGSAGGHLALLAGYTPGHPELTPQDLTRTDLSACGIISFYPPTDLLTMYQYTNQEIMIDRPPVPIGEKLDAAESRRNVGRLDILLGGHPQEAPDMYRLGSPATHVHPGSPPTLLMQGKQDALVPVEGTCALYKKLVETEVPAINIIYPWTNHAFDLILPSISPPAQSSLYDVDRFLALLVNKD